MKLDPIKGEPDSKEGDTKKFRDQGKRSLQGKLPSVLNTLRFAKTGEIIKMIKGKKSPPREKRQAATNKHDKARPRFPVRVAHWLISFHSRLSVCPVSSPLAAMSLSPLA